MRVESDVPFVAKAMRREERWTPLEQEYFAETAPNIMEILQGVPSYRNVAMSDEYEGFPWPMRCISFEILENPYVAEIPTLEALEQLLRDNPKFNLRYNETTNVYVLELAPEPECGG